MAILRAEPGQCNLALWPAELDLLRKVRAEFESSTSSSGLQCATLCHCFNQSLGDITLPSGLRSWLQLSIARPLLEGMLPKDATSLLHSGTSEGDPAAASGKLSEFSQKAAST